MMILGEDTKVYENVRILVYERKTKSGSLSLRESRLTHNVMTNTGRSWAVQLFGSSNYGANPPTANNTAKIKYVGFGCGGALQTNSLFLNSQVELPSVIALQDPVPFSKTGNVGTFLKAVRNQSSTETYFPGINRTVFILDVAETELSFAGSKTYGSNRVVDTEVPISEAGLYLSTALPTYDATDPNAQNTASPTAANSMVAYDIFSPIIVTPNVVLVAEWEIRL